MDSLLTPEELELFRHIPEVELVDLAIELDLPVPEVIRVAELLDAAVVGLAQLARREGLPLSTYDRTDLAELSPEEINALASMCGVRGGLDELIRAGEKVYRIYHKQRPKSQIPLLLPMLLAPLARHAAATEVK